MKNKTVKGVLFSLILIIGILVGCNTPKNNEKESMVGYITLSGSTAIQPLAEKSAEKFKVKYPKSNVMVQGGGSGTGLTQVLQGNVDIGNSDIDANKKLSEEQAIQLVDNKVAVEGFAIITSKDVSVKSLTKKELIQIFSGAKTNWKEFGGEDKKIIVVHRPASSGTRNAFVDKILDGRKQLENDKFGIVQDSNGNVKTTLETTKGAISYIGLSYIKDEKSKELISVLNIDNIEPNSENIANGLYPFWSFAHMYTKGEGNELTKEFIKYIVSEENKEVIKSLGFIPTSDIKIE